MSKLDFEKAKADITSIVDIVKTVPEPLQERCFELLFDMAFREMTPSKQEPEAPHKIAVSPEINSGPPPLLEKKLPSNVRAFMYRQNLTDQDIGKLFMLDHEPLLPVYKIPTGNMAKAQLMKVMMVLLENGLLSNSLTASYADVRESVKEDGLYDGNFSGMIKANQKLFRGAISTGKAAEGSTVELSADGMTRLAEIVKELGSS